MLTLVRWHCSLGLIVVIACRVTGAGNPQESDSPSIAQRYDQLRTAYLAELHQAQDDVKQLESTASRHEQALRELVGVAGDCPACSRTWHDELSLAEAWEMLHDSHQAAHHGSRAIALRPGHPYSYASFLRSSLNLGEMTDAEKFLAQARSECPDSGAVAFFHYFMFIKYKALEEFDPAARHCREFLDFHLNRLDSSPQAGILIARYLDEFFLFWSRRFGPRHALEQLARLERRANTGLLPPTPQALAESPAKAIAGYSNRLGLQADLASLLDRPELAERQQEWTGWLLAQLQAVGSELEPAEQASLLVTALDRMVQRSATWRDTAPIARVGAEVSGWLGHSRLSDMEQERVNRTLQRLDQAVKRQLRRINLIGTIFDLNQPAITWHDQPPTGERPHVVLVVGPDASLQEMLREFEMVSSQLPPASSIVLFQLCDSPDRVAGDGSRAALGAAGHDGLVQQFRQSLPGAIVATGCLKSKLENVVARRAGVTLILVDGQRIVEFVVDPDPLAIARVRSLLLR